jgi:hypothetical protein
MEAEIEIVSDAPIGRLRRKAAKEATAVGADKPAVTGFGAGLESAHPAVERVVRRQPVPVEPDQGGCGAEEIRELVVERVPQNPRLVLASYTVAGRKEIVRVWVGVNRNFKVRMRLKAERGTGENALWRLIGKRPRLPGRW